MFQDWLAGLGFCRLAIEAISFEAVIQAGIDLATGLTTRRFEQWTLCGEIVRKDRQRADFYYGELCGAAYEAD